VEDFRREEQGLVPVQVDRWGPLVFVHLGDAPRPAGLRRAAPAEMGALEGLRFLERREYTLACNWKVFVDNYLDGGYHVNSVHPALGSVLQYSEYRTECFERTSLQSSPMRAGRRRDGGATRTGDRARYAWAFPNVMINLYAGVMDTNVVLPLGPERCRVLIDFYFADLEGDGRAGSRRRAWSSATGSSSRTWASARTCRRGSQPLVPDGQVQRAPRGRHPPLPPVGSPRGCRPGAAEVARRRGGPARSRVPRGLCSRRSLFLLLGAAGLFPVAATTVPSRLEAGSRVSSSGVPSRARRRRSPFPPRRRRIASLLAGLRTFRRNCAGLPREVRRPQPWGTTSFYPRVPQFADEGFALGPAEMFVAVKQRHPRNRNGGVGGNLSDEEIWTAVWFLQRMRALPPAVEQAWKAPPQ
jgi:hypothetical protein